MTNGKEWLFCGPEREWIAISNHYYKKEIVMARKPIRKNQHEEKKETELTPDEIADLLTGGCDNLGLS